MCLRFVPPPSPGAACPGHLMMQHKVLTFSSIKKCSSMSLFMPCSSMMAWVASLVQPSHWKAWCMAAGSIVHFGYCCFKWDKKKYCEIISFIHFHVVVDVMALENGYVNLHPSPTLLAWVIQDFIVSPTLLSRINHSWFLLKHELLHALFDG